MKNLKVAIKKDFGFICDASVLTDAIAKAEYVTTKLSSSTEFEKKHLIFGNKGKLYVVGYSSDTFIVINVKDAEVEDEGSFGYDTKVLTGLIKKRKEMQFALYNNRLGFAVTKGQYKGEIETYEVGDDQVPFLESNMRAKKEALRPLSLDMLKGIREGIAFSDLTEVYNNNEKIVCGIRARKGILDISAHDDFHMAYYKTRVEFKDEFTLSIPVEVFKMIDKFISDEDEKASFYMNNKEFKVMSNSFIVVLPPVQVDKQFFDIVPGYIKLLKNPTATVPFTNAAINTADNMFTLANDETKLSMTITRKGRVDLSLTTEQGKVSDAFKLKDVQCDADRMVAFVDPRIFEDLFKKVNNRKSVNVIFYKKQKTGVASSFVVSASTEKTKAYLVGTYYEEK